MAKPSNLVISTIVRNNRFRGPTFSAHQNDLQEELVRDLGSVQKEWNKSIVPLLRLVPDGTQDSLIDAFKNGLDGRTLYVNTDATLTLDGSSFFLASRNRPRTIFEQFRDVYSTIDSKINVIEEQIAETGGSGITADQRFRIGSNIFNNAAESSAISLDGRSAQNLSNILQLARDMYDTNHVSFSGNGNAILLNSIRDMVGALLELHNGSWADDIDISHSISADDITGGAFGQQTIGNSASAPGGVNDLYSGTPANTVDDLNVLRASLRAFKNPDQAFNATLALDPNWDPVTSALRPTNVRRLTNLKGSGSRTDTNPWGYEYSDVEGLVTRLEAISDFIGSSSILDTDPTYSGLNGFAQGENLTNAIAGLAVATTGASSDVGNLETSLNNHTSNTNNPHTTTLTQAASAGGSAPASQISIIDTGLYYSGATVELALQEVGVSVAGVNTSITTLETDLLTNISTTSGVLAASIFDLDLKLDNEIATFSGVIQTTLDDHESRIDALETSVTNITDSDSFRRAQFAVNNLLDTDSVTLAHNAGMYPQVQCLTLIDLTDNSAGSVLPSYSLAVDSIEIIHSGVNHVTITNRLGETLVSGVVLVNW